jgi:hypothetical protein
MIETVGTKNKKEKRRKRRMKIFENKMTRGGKYDTRIQTVLSCVYPL